MTDVWHDAWFGIVNEAERHEEIRRRTASGILEAILLGMEDALLERGSCTVLDGYALLIDDEVAEAKARQLGHAAVRILRRRRGLRRIRVENSPDPTRHRGYVARWGP